MLLWLCTNSALFPQLLAQKIVFMVFVLRGHGIYEAEIQHVPTAEVCLAAGPAGWHKKESVIINFYFILSLLGNWQHPICFCMHC